MIKNKRPKVEPELQLIIRHRTGHFPWIHVLEELSGWNQGFCTRSPKGLRYRKPSQRRFVPAEHLLRQQFLHGLTQQILSAAPRQRRDRKHVPEDSQVKIGVPKLHGSSVWPGSIDSNSIGHIGSANDWNPAGRTGWHYSAGDCIVSQRARASVLAANPPSSHSGNPGPCAPPAIRLPQDRIVDIGRSRRCAITCCKTSLISLVQRRPRAR